MFFAGNTWHVIRYSLTEDVEGQIAHSCQHVCNCVCECQGAHRE